MGKNYYIFDNNEQNINQIKQTAQLYGSGVILFVGVHALYTEFEIPTVTVRHLFGYENQTYSELEIEKDFKNTGIVHTLNSLPYFTYAISTNEDTYNEKEVRFYLRDALQKQGHYTTVILSEIISNSELKKEDYL